MRIRTCAFVLLALSASVVSSTPSAIAQDSSESDPFTDMARERFQEGVRFFDEGKFEQARAAFLQAYALKKHPAVLLNLAQSELRSNHPVQAARHFSQFLRENPDANPTERKTAEDGLIAARTKTGRVHLVVDVDGAEIFINDEFLERTPLPEPIDVTPGNNKIEIRAVGQTPKTIHVDVTVGRVEPINIAFDVATAEESIVPPPVQEQSAVESQGRQPFFKWLITDEVAWATGGATVLGLGVGIAFAILANNAENNAASVRGKIKAVAQRDGQLNNYLGWDRRDNPCAAPIPITDSADYRSACSQLKDNLDKQKTDETIRNIGFVVFAAGAVGTGVAYYLRTEPKQDSSIQSSKRSSSITPIITPEIQGFAIGGQF